MESYIKGVAIYEVHKNEDDTPLLAIWKFYENMLYYEVAGFKAYEADKIPYDVYIHAKDNNHSCNKLPVVDKNKLVVIKQQLNLKAWLLGVEKYDPPFPEAPPMCSGRIKAYRAKFAAARKEAPQK